MLESLLSPHAKCVVVDGHDPLDEVEARQLFNATWARAGQTLPADGCSVQVKAGKTYIFLRAGGDGVGDCEIRRTFADGSVTLPAGCIHESWLSGACSLWKAGFGLVGTRR